MYVGSVSWTVCICEIEPMGGGLVVELEIMVKGVSK